MKNDIGYFYDINREVSMKVFVEALWVLLAQKCQTIDFNRPNIKIAALPTNYKEIIETIEKISNKSYAGNEISMRIIADHIRTSVFISADYAGIKPSNTDQGYILRRLIRRAIRHAKKLEIDMNSNWLEEIAKEVIKKYEDYYHEIKDNKEVVLEVADDRLKEKILKIVNNVFCKKYRDKIY